MDSDLQEPLIIKSKSPAKVSFTKNEVEKQNDQDKFSVKSDSIKSKKENNKLPISVNNQISLSDLAYSSFKDNSLTFLSALCLNLVHIYNLIVLNRVGFQIDLMPISSYQIAYTYLNIFGFRFIRGAFDCFRNISANAFYNNQADKLTDFYNESRIYSILFFLIVIFPLGFIPNYILPFLDMSEGMLTLSTTLIKILMFANLFDFISEYNTTLLRYQELNIIILTINSTMLSLHIVFSLLLVFYFNYGTIGVAISMLICSLVRFISSELLLMNYNPLNNNVMFSIRTDALEKTSFFYFSRQASINGVVSFFKYTPFDMVSVFCYFISNSSFLATIIVLNIIGFLFNMIVSVTENFERLVNSYLHKNLMSLSTNETELNEFLECDETLRKYFKNKGSNVEKLDKLKKINENKNNDKYEKVKIILEDKYLDFNIDKIQLLIKTLIIFCMIFAFVFSVFLLIFKNYIAALFIFDLDIRSMIVKLLFYYSFFIFFDWGCQLFVSLIGIFTSITNYLLIRGLFAMFFFLPLGTVLYSLLGDGVNGYWYSFYLYFVLYCFISIGIYKNLDIKAKIKLIKKRYEIRIKSLDEVENYYK